MLMYGRNFRTDNRVTANKVASEDRNVRFQRPESRQDNRPRRGSYSSETRGINVHVCYVKEENYDPECTLNIR